MEQILYIASVAVYFLALLLFVRMQLWRFWAEKTYWHRRPKLSVEALQEMAGEQDLPYISTLVPAYRESEVIGNTIEHLAGLHYPAAGMEIIVIIDQKELLGGDGLTTQEVTENKFRELAGRSGLATLRHLVVPADFNGKLHGICLGRPMPSTKGRALNFALPQRKRRASICAFYDAESRLDRDALLYVAYRRLVSKGQVRIWQGPVYQVRNFFCFICLLNRV